MGDIRIATREGPETRIRASSVESFAAGLRGSLIAPGAPDYDAARRVWNGMVDRRPALIARCAGRADVVAAVDFARERDLLVAVRGGGHNVAGNAVCDGGLVIDLSAMRGVRADPGARRARAGGGATWGDFDAETQLFGLATTGGLISSTGVAGLTLGGGIGWLAGRFGLACDNLASVDVVTADGSCLTASEAENAELFWGLKGGGGNFGVATSFEFRVHTVGPEVYGGMVAYPLEAAPDGLGRLRELMAGAPDELGAIAGLTSLPTGEPALLLIAVHSGAAGEGERLLAPLRRIGTPIADTFGPVPYRQVQTLFDAGTPHGQRYYWKSSFLEGLPDAAIGVLVAQCLARPSPRSKIFVEFLGGAIGRVPREAAVFDHREARHNLLVIGQWEDPAEDAANRAWARETWAAMQAHASAGVYMNYLGTEEDEGANRVPAAYGPGKFERLVALKRRYDPANLFRMNQNIRPG